MSCVQWQDRLVSYVDGELPAAEMEDFRSHAANCQDCASGALALIESKAALRRAGHRYTASPEFRARVQAAAAAQAPALRIESGGTVQQPRRLRVIPQAR